MGKTGRAHRGTPTTTLERSCVKTNHHKHGDFIALSLVVGGTAVGMDRLSGDEASILADEEQTGCRDLFGCPLPSERDAFGTRRSIAIPFRIVSAGIDAARRDDVYPDIVSREFRGEAACETDETHL